MNKIIFEQVAHGERNQLIWGSVKFDRERERERSP